MRGPSLYSLPGVSGDIEQASYLIGQRNELAATERLRAMKAKREEAAYGYQDQLFQEYGTGLITGNVTRSTIIQRLSQLGASGPEITETLNLINRGLADSAGVADAQMRARSQDPGQGKVIMDLMVEAQRSGYSESLEDRVSDMVLDGTLSGDDGARIVGSAVQRSESLRKEAEADVERAEAKEGPGSKVKSVSRLNEEATNQAVYIIQQVNARRKAAGLTALSEKQLEDTQLQLAMIARAHLATNPGDYEGAFQRMKAAATGRLRGYLSAVKKPTKPKASTPQGSSANTRR
jgi:hypothetical protein